MRAIFPCRRLFEVLAIAATLPLLFAASSMPFPAHAQTPPQADTQERNVSSNDMRDIPAQTLFNQAVLLEQESLEKAAAKYDEVMQRFGRAASPGSRQFAARALLNIGSIRSKQGNDKDAIATYERIDKNFKNEKSPAIREVLASALVSKAEALYRLEGADKAIAAYDQFHMQFNDNNDFIKRLTDITKWRVAEINISHKTTLSSRQ